MRLGASNGSWWQPILLAGTGLVILFPTFSLADDQVWTKSINLTGNAAFNRSTADLVLAIHDSALSGLGSSGSISLRGNQDSFIVGAPGEMVTLDIRNFALTGHSTLTLQGTATTSFIINVTKQFSLSGSTRIILSGGLRWDHVFFNVLGRGGAVFLSGRAQLYGTLTARERTVQLRGQSIVFGNVVAKRVLLSGAAQIIPLPFASP
jgi:hypothetical protein